MAEDKITTDPEVLAHITLDDIIDALQAVEDSLQTHGGLATFKPGMDSLLDDFMTRGYDRLLNTIGASYLKGSKLGPGGPISALDYILEYADDKLRSDVVSHIYGAVDTFPNQVAKLMALVRSYDSPYLIRELLILWGQDRRLMNIATRELTKLYQKYRGLAENGPVRERNYYRRLTNNAQEVLDWIEEHRV